MQNPDVLQAESILATAAVRAAEKPRDMVCVGNTQVIVTQRKHDYHVCIAGWHSMWDCGKTVDEAIDRLKLSWPEEF